MKVAFISVTVYIYQCNWYIEFYIPCNYTSMSDIYLTILNYIYVIKI